jgi:phosphatidylglycerophosphatase A
MFKKLAVLVANGFGLGLSPVASGTVGSLLGVALALGMARLPLGWYVAVCLLLCLLAVPVCDVAEDVYARKDDGRIVADEYLTFPICMIALPVSPLMLCTAFLTCRVMDIVKPPPARQLQKIHGGWGIVVDDVLASLYSLLANHLLFWFVLTPLFGKG